MHGHNLIMNNFYILMKNEKSMRFLILQVKNDANITIKGRVVDSAELLPLSVINQNGLAVANSIESAGLYIVPVEGMSGVEISAEGSVSVVVKAIG